MEKGDRNSAVEEPRYRKVDTFPNQDDMKAGSSNQCWLGIHPNMDQHHRNKMVLLANRRWAVRADRMSTAVLQSRIRCISLQKDNRRGLHITNPFFNYAHWYGYNVDRSSCCPIIVYTPNRTIL